MGVVAKVLGGLLGTTPAPKADIAPAVSQVDEESAKAKRARTALLETASGQPGQQLQPGQVQQSSTLFGN